MKNRTDLALESYESRAKSRLKGVIVDENDSLSVVKVITPEGASAIGKPIGTYITLMLDSFASDIDLFDGRLTRFASVLRRLMPDDLSSVLVVGLGNKRITADSLGPKVGNYVFSTRHIENDIIDCDLLPVSSIATGVLGDTGIESSEIIKGVVNQISPSCIIVVDALAASSADRLGTTVQFSDVGISPGSGVGNHRNEITLDTMGVPVVSIGIPTVVSTAVISGNDCDDSFVTPRDIDRITEHGAKLIGMGINACLQPDMNIRDLYSLVG